ncbi:hypothetical protein Tco_0914624, partial [Tanacetum coccineum]
SPIPTTRIHSIHPKDQIIGDPKSAVQTRIMAKKSKAGLVSFINKQRRTNHKDFHNCLFACFLSQVEPKKVNQALDDVSWVEAMQEELFQFKLLNVWTLVDLPKGKKAIAYTSYMDFTVYQMDVKSAFLYGTIEEELLELSMRLYQPTYWKMDSEETHKSLSSDAAKPYVDVHLYRSMIGTLMYLTSSRPDIMFAVCACSRFQVTPKVSHIHAVKRIFRYLKGEPTLGLWYPKDSPMDLIAYSDSDYAGASIDRKSTTRCCQFLGARLLSWQCKKQTIVANSTTEAKYIAASHCCGQFLWLQNQLLDYGYNFMRTKIHIDNESTISVIKNPVSHSKTKHIEI